MKLKLTNRKDCEKDWKNRDKEIFYIVFIEINSRNDKEKPRLTGYYDEHREAINQRLFLSLVL